MNCRKKDKYLTLFKNSHKKTVPSKDRFSC
jgi:hypothetical protein